jgi:hypothetical protein
MPWSTRFPDPIALPAGGKLATLQDAGEYITRLPKQTHDAPPWQNAMHVLIQAAEYDGPIEFARLGMLQALFPGGTPRRSPQLVLQRMLEILDHEDVGAAQERLRKGYGRLRLVE